MSENKDYSNAAINALYGAEPISTSATTTARVPKARANHTLHNRQQNSFGKKSPINLYSLIFAACATISMLTYFVAK